MKDSLLYKDLVEPAHWVGLRKCDDLLEYLRVSGKKNPTHIHRNGAAGMEGVGVEICISYTVRKIHFLPAEQPPDARSVSV